MARMADLRSASAKMMCGDLPPSSRLMRFSVPAAWRMMCWPVRVLPVKAILSTSGCVISASPASVPMPDTMFTTPGGKPAWLIRLPRYSAVSGVCSAGLSTTVLPAASAGASFMTAMNSGKFHGTIWPMTPIGSRRV